MTQTIDYQGPRSSTPDVKPRRWHIFGWVFFIGLAVLIFLLMNSNRRQYERLPLSDFRVLLQEGAVETVTIEGDTLSGRLLPNQRSQIVHFRTELPQGTTSSWQFTQWLLENRGGAEVEARNQTNLFLQIFLPLVPWLLIFGFIWFFVFRQLRRGGIRHDPMRVVVVGQEPPPVPRGAS